MRGGAVLWQAPVAISLLPDATLRWLVIIAVVLLLAMLLTFLTRPREDEFPFRLEDSLLTPAELVFFEALSAAVGEVCALTCKTRLADIITVCEGATEWRAHFNRIQAKHIDFVVCDPVDMAPLVLVELDDASHDRPDRRQRDAFVDQAAAAAGIPILHIPVAAEYRIDDLRQQVMAEVER